MFKKIALYSTIGLSAAFIELILFVFLLKIFTDNPYSSNTIALIFSIFYSYYLNSHFNFRKKDRYFRRAIKFYIVCGIGILISNFLIFMLTKKFDLYIAKILSIPIVVLFQFSLNLTWTFRNYK